MLHATCPAIDETATEIGFYSIVHLETIGYCGGYLVINAIGRPVEFHCTFPVKPERSQEILYGRSLRPYLYSEHIGRPLIAKARTQAGLVLINQREALQLGSHITLPVAWIGSGEEEPWNCQAADPQYTAVIQSRLRQWQSIDLLEPFERIATALEEAHAVNRQECA